jgi:hypothetical protein
VHLAPAAVENDAQSDQPHEESQAESARPKISPSGSPITPRSGTPSPSSSISFTSN